MPLSAEAAGRSALLTSSGSKARQVGVSMASPAEARRSATAGATETSARQSWSSSRRPRRPPSRLPCKESASGGRRYRQSRRPVTREERTAAWTRFVSARRMWARTKRDHKPRRTHTLHEGAHVRDNISNQEASEDRTAKRTPQARSALNHGSAGVDAMDPRYCVLRERSAVCLPHARARARDR
jgi:hypothetical protein